MTSRNYAPIDPVTGVVPIADLATGTPDGTKFIRDDGVLATPASSGAPTTADYLTGTTQAGLSAEIVVGTTPGGELGGTWGSPTVDATHSGSAHHTEDHVLATDTALGAHHTISGGVAGYVLRALTATTAKFMQLVHGDLGSVGINDHHNRDHASAHGPAAADPLKLDDTAAPDDNTDNNASTGAHGLLRKLSGVATDFLAGDGSWGSPSGTGAPANADYLTGSANGVLSAEIVVGTTPGGELGGSWGSPTVDATHSGSAHKATSLDVQAFTTAADTTWTKPAGAKLVLVVCIGGGGGGGAGRKGATSTGRFGGYGGGGGGLSAQWFNASDLGSSEKLTVGALGGGASAQSTNTTDGANGTAGAASFFGNSATGVGTDAKVSAGGGGGGPGGSTGQEGFEAWTVAQAGAGTAKGGHTTVSGSSATASIGGDGGGAGGGGQGGSISAGNAVGAGGSGGVSGGLSAWARAAGSAATSGSAGGTGTGAPSNNGIGGQGGAGGGASATGGTNGGAGGPGGAPGGGGGGGGAALNATNNSGAGGSGAAGQVLVISILDS